jgi:hypothetical protein
MKKSDKAVGVGINAFQTQAMRDKLIAEITEYQRQQAALKLNGDKVDFSLIQTYKELIHARQELLQRLPLQY